MIHKRDELHTVHVHVKRCGVGRDRHGLMELLARGRYQGQYAARGSIMLTRNDRICIMVKLKLDNCRQVAALPMAVADPYSSVFRYRFR
ncbi:hypothetical protein EVAR_64572_1 [Eumeta japonica]|uniref:Uncharacterized protein n=1 Tax=Eumeta variegata TaxID=151549 RepID=A0A4C1Z9W5_EUMVA|nr:hypothetical protein EVAR_64572_1 [Eumeta japonica]